MTVQLTIDAPRNHGAELFFKIALAMGIMVAVLEIGYLIYSPLPYDPVGYLIGRDFVNTWLGGQLALTGDPGAFFGPDAYNGLLAERFGPNYPRHIWSYPPQFLLFTWPFGLMPYVPAYLVYTLIGLFTYLAVASEGQLRADRLLLLIMAPAVIVNAWCGQTGFFVAALMIGGLVSLERRPILAGVLFGLLTIKPQLGLLIPVMLLLTGRWRTIGAAAATVAVLVAAATIAFGPKVWTAYINDAMPTQGAVVAKSFEHFMVHMPTAFMNMRIAGFSMPVAIAAQMLLSAVALAAVIWTFWRRRERDLSNMLLVTASFLATPYAFNYDMVVFGWVAIKLMERSDTDAWDYLIMLAVWAVPFMTVPIGMAGMPISVLPMLALAGRLVWRIWKIEQARSGTPAGRGSSLVDLLLRADDRHAGEGALQVADPFLEIVGQAFQPLPDRLVPEAPRQLAVTVGEPSQIGHVVHGELPLCPPVNTSDSRRFRPRANFFARGPAGQDDRGG